MKKIGLILIITAIALFCIAGRSEAALLGLELGLPDILSDSAGTYIYDSSTDLLSFSATPTTITFDGATLIPISDPTGGTRSYSAKFYVDSSGNLSGGIPTADLTITGKFTYGSTTYDGTLVRGDVTNFGWTTISGTSYKIFDWTFTETGTSLLSSFYAPLKYLGGNVTFAESSSFTGSWTSDHAGTRVKHNTAPIPEPTSLLLLGSGLLGVALLGVRKRKI